MVGHCALSYDVKGLLSVFASGKEKHNLKVLAKNKEKFHCLYMDNYMLIDSHSFLQGSLQTLTDSLRKKGEEHFVYTKQFAKSENRFRLLTKKGVMCYNYIDKDFASKFEETTLPAKKYFYDSLKNEEVSDEKYAHACNVFETFECKCLRDYLLVYLGGDVTQLADVFTAFRKTFYEDFGLDATHYISLPQLAFDALLKESRVRLELISDIDMYNWITHSIRGGFAGVLCREAVANNKYMNTYDPTLDDSYIMMFDVCNLYGTCIFLILIEVNHWLCWTNVLYVFTSCFRLYHEFKTDAT